MRETCNTVYIPYNSGIHERIYMKTVIIRLILIVLISLGGMHSAVLAQEKNVNLESIVYDLPFPGILPTHPLYFLKTFRDSLIEMMITSDVKKAEFYILQADKRLQMSASTSLGNNTQLIETMRNEALLYREKSLETLVKALGKNIVIPRYVLEKLVISSKKHKEVLEANKADTAGITSFIAKAEVLFKTQIDKK